MATFATASAERPAHIAMRMGAHRRAHLLQKQSQSAGRSGSKDTVRSSQRDWLDLLVRETGGTLSKIAVASGVQASTLTRFYNGTNGYDGILSPMVVQAVSEATGIAGPGAEIARVTNHAFREDGEPFLISIEDPRAKAVAALVDGNANAHAWVMRSNVLALAHVTAGDILIIDQAVEARDGDIVCAQIEVGLGAKTVFRIYQRPSIVGATYDPIAVKPEVVDGSRVRIAGVMTGLFRSR